MKPRNGDRRSRRMQVGQSAPARDGMDRHGRMLKGEFDVAEFSMSTYLMAIDRKLPITGVPVFPRRLFSAGLFYRARGFAAAHARRPQGQARRDPLVPDHAVDARQGRSQVRIRRALGGDPLAARGRGEDRVRRRSRDCRSRTCRTAPTSAYLLRDGKVDAVIQPHPPHSMTSGEVPLRRLFADPDAEELRYFKKYGYFPIMHILAIRKELAERDPSLPRTRDGDVRARRARSRQDYFSDPELVEPRLRPPLFRAREDMFGKDIWPTGLAANRNNLERFMMYSRDQGLIRRRSLRSTTCSRRSVRGLTFDTFERLGRG